MFHPPVLRTRFHPTPKPVQRVILSAAKNLPPTCICPDSSRTTRTNLSSQFPFTLQLTHPFAQPVPAPKPTPKPEFVTPPQGSTAAPDRATKISSRLGRASSTIVAPMAWIAARVSSKFPFVTTVQSRPPSGDGDSSRHVRRLPRRLLDTHRYRVVRRLNRVEAVAQHQLCLC